MVRLGYDAPRRIKGDNMSRAFVFDLAQFHAAAQKLGLYWVVLDEIP
jgi:hypothetical protein